MKTAVFDECFSVCALSTPGGSEQTVSRPRVALPQYCPKVARDPEGSAPPPKGQARQMNDRKPRMAGREVAAMQMRAETWRTMAAALALTGFWLMLLH